MKLTTLLSVILEGHLPSSEGGFNTKIALLSIGWMFACVHALSAQDNFRMAYGEKLPLGSGQIHASAQFSEGGTIKILRDDEIRNYVFQHPGSYSLFMTNRQNLDEDHCTDLILPSRISVWVDSVRISFLEGSMQLSAPIIRNINSSGIILSIDILVESYYSRSVRMNLDTIATAGVGTEIKAIPDEPTKILIPGRHRLNYRLSGYATEAGYIQFDFKDHIGRIVPIGLKTKIQEN